MAKKATGSKKKTTRAPATAKPRKKAAGATSPAKAAPAKKPAASKTTKKKKVTSKQSTKKPAAKAKAAAPDAAAAAALDEAVDESAVSRSLDATTGPISRKKINGSTHSPPSPPSEDTHAPADDAPLTDDELRKVKTGLKKRDLEMLRQLLAEKRADILGDVAAMDRVRNSDSGGDVSHMPLHMADVGSDHYEQEFTLGLVESERKLLREIDEALARLRNGTYGVCQQSGQPIPMARLEIKPWAKYTIEVVRERERRGLD